MNLISRKSLSGVSTGEVLQSIGTAWCIVLIVVTFLQVAIVCGDSMKPTLMDGDMLLVSRFSKIEKGDIVIAYPEKKCVVKRVAGVEGDRIAGTIIRKGEYYLIGDNRNHSRDSRDYGSTDAVYGKVIWRILPRFGKP